MNDALATTMDTVTHAPPPPPPLSTRVALLPLRPQLWPPLHTPKTRHTPLVPSLNV